MPQINVDEATAKGFGDEWTRFDQSALSEAERQKIFDEYFSLFPMSVLHQDAIGADFGTGSGRWAMVVAPLVHELICVDASVEALTVAKKNLSLLNNCRFIESTVNDADIDGGTLDFGYSLGVLHHIPNTQSALDACVLKLKPGAPFLLYLYYRFDNRPRWFRALWWMSNLGRKGVSRLPYGMRYWVSQCIAAFVYWPLARFAKVAALLGAKTDNFPLSYYRDKSFYVMRTDALDRFGTRLEQRFTRAEIRDMMIKAGLVDIQFSPNPPYWCAVGFKKAR